MTSYRSSPCELILLLFGACIAGLSACSGRALILDGAAPPGAVNTADAGAGVVEKLPLPDEILSFWVDDTRLYWETQSEWFRSCLHDDCDRTTITYGRGRDWISLGDNDLFWSPVAGPSGVSACPKAGCSNGAPVWVVRDAHETAGAASGDYYYWSSAFDIFRCPSSGCGEIPEVVARGETTSYLQLAGSHAYWTNVRVGSDDASIVTEIRGAPLDGSEPPTTVQTTSTIRGGVLVEAPVRAASVRQYFSVDTQNLYWIDDSSQVQSCPLERCNSQPPTPLATSDHPKDWLVVDATGLYWLESDPNFEPVVMYCPLSGCGSEPRPLTAGHRVGSWSPVTSPFALDSTYLYWQEAIPDTKSIRRVRKPTP